MFQDGSFSTLKAVELDEYVTYHKLGKLKTKKAKIEAIKWNIMRQLSGQIGDQAIEEEGSEDVSNRESGKDSDEDCVLTETGDSSSEEEVQVGFESAEMSACYFHTVGEKGCNFQIFNDRYIVY